MSPGATVCYAMPTQLEKRLEAVAKSQHKVDSSLHDLKDSVDFVNA